MSLFVKDALIATLDQFEQLAPFQGSAEFKAGLVAIFDQEADFMSKAAAMDEKFNDHPQAEALREVVFDLLLVNFFVNDTKRLEDDYLESKEWEEIEEETLDRGTELLNVLLYLRECREDKLEPSLDDFLKEFLLVEDDEFQDEYMIYEDVIANQDLVDADFEEIGEVANKLPAESEFRDLFYPVMGFFSEMQPDEAQMKEFIENSAEPEFEAAVYSLLIHFNK